MVPPFYLKAFNKRSEQAAQAKKEKFYGILSELETELGAIKVYDYFDAMPEQRSMYDDYSHLNAYGAAEFTKLINRDILG